jgi:hypothetical protein
MKEEQSKPITISFPDGKVAKQVVNLLVRKKPKGWAHRSYASYYKLVYAEWLLRDINEMMVDRQPRIFPYDKWPNVSPSSLYLRVNQATAYILDNLDPDGKYARFFEQIKCRRIPKVGVKLCFDDVLADVEPGGEKFIGDDDAPAWKQKMDAYLESDDETVEPFHQTGLMLTPEQVAQLELELSGLSSIMYSVSCREIKIIKS